MPPALYIGREVVLWHAYRRTRGGIEDTLLAYEVHEGDMEGALKRIVARVKPSSGLVLAHLAPETVLTRLVPVPELDGAELETWMCDQVESSLPEGYAPGELAAETTFAGTLEEDTGGRATPTPRLLVGVTPFQAIEETQRLLAAAGLRPAALYALPPLVGYAFLGEAAFAEDTALVRWARGFDARYERGLLRDVHYAPQPAEPAAFVLVEPQAEAFEAESGNADAAVHASSFGITRAMANTYVYSGLTRLDFLPDEARVASRVALDRQGARKSALVATLVLLVTFGPLGLYAAWAGHLERATQQALAQRVPDLKALEREEAILAAESSARSAELVFAHRRSRAAAWMDAAARAATPGMTLSAFTLSADSMGAASGFVRGEARSEAIVGSYAERLRALGLGGELRYVLRPETRPGEARPPLPLAFEIALTGHVEAGP